MSFIRIESIEIENFRSFKEKITIEFPERDYKKPISIIGYNNSGKTNLMNAILYGIGINYVNENTFELKDIHNLDKENKLSIKSKIDSSKYTNAWGNPQQAKGEYSIEAKYDLERGVISKRNVEFSLNSENVKSSIFGVDKQYKVFYINFHEIKKEINTNKTSWGNITSFLGKHIQSIIDTDIVMKNKKDDFVENNKQITNEVMEDSELESFISSIRRNYINNLRGNKCHIEFTLPDYEDIFLNMIFKVGLNDRTDNLVPIDHFGDGYISMFIMAVIQAIGESSNNDKCLFLFEEPESFLHENHQKYFYENVLCDLANNGHQVIYTTHSAHMIDIFDTKSIIRLDYDNIENKTVLCYNNAKESLDYTNIINIENYNQYIKSIEPNLNKILFSKKVILVEGPNDLMVYDYVIKRKIEEKINELVSSKGHKISNDSKVKKYASTYLNFQNIAIIPHHGKSTVHLLVNLCNHFNIDFFVITDFDLKDDLISKLSTYKSEEDLKNSTIYNNHNYKDKKGILTINWKIINRVGLDKLHFNIDKLETVIGYDKSDKDSLNIWKLLNETKDFNKSLIPDKLIEFLNINEIKFEDVEHILE